MHTRKWLKVSAIGLLALQLQFLTAYSQQRRGLETQVYTETPPGLIKRVEPEFPADVVMRHVSGRGLFRLTINSKSGEVDEVKIVKSCGYKILNELAAKALLQWRFQSGTAGPVEVPVEFFVHGGGRVLH